MKKMFTMALALVGVAGMALADGISIETAPAGYLEKTSSSNQFIWVCSTYASFTNNVPTLGDIGVNSAFRPGQDMIKIYDKDGKLVVSATYDGGWYSDWNDNSKAACQNGRQFEYGDSLLFVSNSDGAGLVFSGLLETNSVTRQVTSEGLTWLGNVNPINAALDVQSIVPSGFKSKTDFLKVYGTDGALLKSFTVGTGDNSTKWYEMVTTTKEVTSRGKTKTVTISALAENPSTYTLAPGQGFVVLAMTDNASVKLPGAAPAPAPAK